MAHQEARARRAETKLVSESRALIEANNRATDLEESLAVLHAEDRDSVVDLVAWEEQTEHKAVAKKKQKRLKQA